MLTNILTGGLASATKAKTTDVAAARKRQSRTASVEAIKHKIVASIEHAANDARTGSRRVSIAAKLVSDLAHSDSATRKLAVRT